MKFKLLTFILLLSSSISAQNFDFIVGASTSHFLGDLGGKPSLGTNDLSDLDLLSTRYAFTVGLRANMGRHFAFRTNLWYARVSGNDKYTKNRERHGRNLQFFSNIWEADAVLEANIYRTA